MPGQTQTGSIPARRRATDGPPRLHGADQVEPGLHGQPGLRAGLVEQGNDNCVEGRIDGLDVTDLGIDDLFGGEIAGLDGGGQFRGAEMARVFRGAGFLIYHFRHLLLSWGWRHPENQTQTPYQTEHRDGRGRFATATVIGDALSAQTL